MAQTVGSIWPIQPGNLRWMCPTVPWSACQARC